MKKDEQVMNCRGNTPLHNQCDVDSDVDQIKKAISAAAAQHRKSSHRMIAECLPNPVVPKVAS